ncbi:hypothetical protein [Bacillus pumilus]|nr:hypothetical protein [Bacillus pumilus]
MVMRIAMLLLLKVLEMNTVKPVSYTHLTLPTSILPCRWRGWPGA